VNLRLPSAQQLQAFGLDAAWSKTLHVSSHDGAAHTWHYLDRPGTASNAPVVVCLHGNPTWSFLWSRVFAELNPAYRVIAPDHLSMGWSDNVGARRYRDRVADVHDFLDALHVRGPVWLVAQDWGGAIAMGFAVASPERVQGMVLSNTGIAIPANRRAPLLIRISALVGLHRLITRTTSLFVRGTPFLPGIGLSRDQRKALAAPYIRASQRVGVGGFVADVPFTDSHPSAHDISVVADRLRHLTIPVRLVWGSRDPVFNDDFAADLMSHLSDVSLHRVARAGHLAVLETSIAPLIEEAMTQEAQKNAHTSLVKETTTSEITEMLWARIVSAANKNAVAISDAAANEVVSHAEFESRVATFAAALTARGVKSGDRLAVLVPPSIDLIALVYACWRIGAVTVVADRGLGLTGLRHAVRSARVQHVVGPLQALAASRVLRWAPGALFISLSSLRKAPMVTALSEVSAPEPDIHQSAAVLFTSGATGPAKGVRYTHAQLCAQRDALEKTYGITRQDSFVAAFAPFALFGPALGICTGLADMDVTSPRTLTATALNDACRRISASMVFASPAALANVLNTANGPCDSLASVRLVLSAGAPVPLDTLQKMRSLCPVAELHTPYGMTELLPVADISLAQREQVGNGRGVCVGQPVRGCNVMISSPQSLERLPVGQTGELLARAAWMSSGYDKLWMTERAARPSDGVDSWHRTGDVGHCDAEGNLWIEGRLVHVIHTERGVVTPVPLEVLVEAVPGVERAAAVGIGPVGAQVVVIVVEAPAESPGLASVVLTRAVRDAVRPQSVAAVWCTKSLPVDIRHNSKIDRTAVALEMSQRLSGGSS
jgi:acyl-CoA synthetase (AMP-forming)/AMP-acid ligase II/pimeloyl-ACP methyl ester carboxylesterase